MRRQRVHGIVGTVAPGFPLRGGPGRGALRDGSGRPGASQGAGAAAGRRAIASPHRSSEAEAVRHGLGRARRAARRNVPSAGPGPSGRGGGARTAPPWPAGARSRSSGSHAARRRTRLSRAQGTTSGAGPCSTRKRTRSAFGRARAGRRPSHARARPWRSCRSTRGPGHRVPPPPAGTGAARAPVRRSSSTPRPGPTGYRRTAPACRRASRRQHLPCRPDPVRGVCPEPGPSRVGRPKTADSPVAPFEMSRL